MTRLCGKCGEVYNPYAIMPHDKIDLGLDPMGEGPNENTRCWSCLMAYASNKPQKDEQEDQALKLLSQIRDVLRAQALISLRAQDGPRTAAGQKTLELISKLIGITVNFP